MSGELWQLSARAIASAVRTRQVSACEVLDDFSRRLDALNPVLNAFCTLALESARRSAEDIDHRAVRGEPLGALAGVPMGVKDLIFTRGLTTTGGSYAYRDFVPEEDDIVVERIRAADALVVGKTNIAELGYTGGSLNRLFGATRNPWNTALSPGGSSSGSACAVAVGLGPAALGSDGGGSIRVPASYCGLYGFKPAMGRVPLYPGCRDERFPGLSGWESLEQLGPLTRTVDDAALVLDVIAGPDPRDRHSIPLEFGWDDILEHPASLAGSRIALSLDFGRAKVDDEVRVAVERAAAFFANECGCVVDRADPPTDGLPELFAATVFADSDINGMRVLLDELGDRITPRLHEIIGREWGLEQVNAAAMARKRLCREMATFMSTYDLLLTPTAPSIGYPAESHGPARIAGLETTPADWVPFTNLANLTGQPAASLPVGFASNGVPIGMQIVGRHLADREVLAASAAFEAARPWAQSWPAIAEISREAAADAVT